MDEQHPDDDVMRVRKYTRFTGSCVACGEHGPYEWPLGRMCPRCAPRPEARPEALATRGPCVCCTDTTPYAAGSEALRICSPCLAWWRKHGRIWPIPRLGDGVLALRRKIQRGMEEPGRDPKRTARNRRAKLKQARPAPPPPAPEPKKSRWCSTGQQLTPPVPSTELEIETWREEQRRLAEADRRWLAVERGRASR